MTALSESSVLYRCRLLQLAALNLDHNDQAAAHRDGDGCPRGPVSRL